MPGQTRKQTRSAGESPLKLHAGFLHTACPTCGGRGEVKTARTVCYEVLREILREARAFNAREYSLIASQAVDTAVKTISTVILARLLVPEDFVVGRALALGVGDEILMMEYAIYSVISPEGCASILWRDPAKAPEAAAAMRLRVAQATLAVIGLGSLYRIASLREGGEAIAAQLGGERFSALSAAYRRRFPSQDADLNHYGDRMGDLLAGHRRAVDMHVERRQKDTDARHRIGKQDRYSAVPPIGCNPLPDLRQHHFHKLR